MGQLSLLGQQLGARTEEGRLETLVVLDQSFRGLPSFLDFVQAVPLLKNFIVGRYWNCLDSAFCEAFFAEVAGALDKGRSRLQSLRLLGLGASSLLSIPPHTGHISIGGQDREIEGKIGGISGQNRGQIGGKKGEFPNKIEGKINQNKGTHYFKKQDVWWLLWLAMPPN